MYKSSRVFFCISDYQTVSLTSYCQYKDTAILSTEIVFTVGSGCGIQSEEIISAWQYCSSSYSSMMIRWRCFFFSGSNIDSVFSAIEFHSFLSLVATVKSIVRAII